MLVSIIAFTIVYVSVAFISSHFFIDEKATVLNTVACILWPISWLCVSIVVIAFRVFNLED